MRPETSDDSCNIPATGQTVKQVLTDALAGSPVRVHDLALSLSKDATVGEALSALNQLRDADNHMCVRSRFCQGDLFRQMELRGADKRAFIAGVKAQHGENYYNTLRRYAWVAAKWPRVRRTDKRSWAFYVNNEPGRPVSAKVEKPPMEITFVSAETVDGVLVEHWTTPNGNPCVSRKAVQP